MQTSSRLVLASSAFCLAAVGQAFSMTHTPTNYHTSLFSLSYNPAKGKNSKKVKAHLDFRHTRKRYERDGDRCRDWKHALGHKGCWAVVVLSDHKKHKRHNHWRRKKHWHWPDKPDPPSEVPLPGTLPLLGTVLGGAYALRRWRRQRLSPSGPSA